ncbi:gamma-aminobutyric acid type B receptor subunit 2 isoform X1, partial [Tachysurus ichikawai]
MVFRPVAQRELACVAGCSVEGQEVKVGEYNAIADILDLINNTIRFQ